MTEISEMSMRLYLVCVNKSRQNVLRVQYTWYLLTGAVVIDHRDRPPSEEMNQVQYGPTQRGEIRIQADIIRVSVIRHLMFPAGLNVRDAQGVRYRLHRIGRWAVGGAKDGCHAQRELLTRCGWDEWDEWHFNHEARCNSRCTFNNIIKACLCLTE